MDPIEKLSAYFLKFPGIGRRQARRFVYHLLAQDPKTLNEFTDLLRSIKQEVFECVSCHRFFIAGAKHETLCNICKDPNTDTATLMVVEKDADMETIRKSGAYSGRYFILGGTLPLFEKNPDESIRAHMLFRDVEKHAADGTLKEVIMALSANTEGEHTSQYVAKLLEPLTQKYKLTISVLGRGLSTGTELEYSDSDTLKSALKNRS